MRCELPKLFKGCDLFERCVADKQQLLPQAFEFLGALIVEHQPAQVFIFTVVKREGDDFVDRNDAGVAKGCGEEVAELGERFFELLALGRALIHDDGSGMR